MGRTYKGQKFNLGFDMATTKPLDSRAVVDRLSDIYIPDTWKHEDGNYYVYPGMVTAIAADGSVAAYIGRANNPLDIADEDKWVVHSAQGGGDGNAKILHFTQTQWNDLKAKPQTFLEFCETYNGWDVFILDDGTEDISGPSHPGDAGGSSASYDNGYVMAAQASVQGRYVYISNSAYDNGYVKF